MLYVQKNGRLWLSLLELWNCEQVGVTMIRPVLCIIDVQEFFRAARFAVPGVERQIKIFRQREWPIILVNYSGVGAAYPEVIWALEGYGNYYRVEKNADDGSDAIIMLADRAGIDLSTVVMCGVNTCYCVKETALGLIAKEGIKIKLAANAVHCDCHWATHGGADDYDQERQNHCITAARGDIAHRYEKKKIQHGSNRQIETLF